MLLFILFYFFLNFVAVFIKIDRSSHCICGNWIYGESWFYVYDLMLYDDILQSKYCLVIENTVSKGKMQYTYTLLY